MNDKNKSIITVLIIISCLIFTCWNLYNAGYDDGHHDGFRRGVAYQTCIDEMGSDCTKELVDTVYYPHEKKILVYIYPNDYLYGLKFK